MMEYKRHRQVGFTLVEVLISLTLLMIVGASVAQSMATSFETKQLVSEANDRYHEGRQVVTRMARELRMAFLRAEVPKEKREEDPAVLTRFKGTTDELYFASTAHVRLYARTRESDQAEIAYFLEPGDRSSGYRGKTLYRRESRRLDNKPDKGGYVWPIVEGVKSLKFEFWDDLKEIGGDAWERDWDSHENELEPLLPSRIRITLELEMPDRRPALRFVTQAQPRLRRPINVIDAQVQGRAK
jgi:general secretion pathway protein J